MSGKSFTPVKSADRVFDIMEEIIKHEEGMHIRELGKKLNIADSSIHALVHTMLHRKYLKMDESRKLFLGPKFYQFCNRMSANPLVIYSKPLMKDLKNRFNENVHLAVLDGLDVVYIAYEQSTHPVRYHVEIGKSQPAHVTGVGKMLLSAYPEHKIRELYREYNFEKFTPATIASADELVAELERVRQRGYSVDDGESYDGTKCFAAPIYDASGKMIASMSISIPFVRFDDDRDQEMIAAIKDTTQKLSRILAENS